jgi:endoplasmic reticulum chaperone BiP
MSQFKRQSGIDVSDDKRAKQRLQKQCENAKRTLSTQTSATIDCEALANGQDFSTATSRANIRSSISIVQQDIDARHSSSQG